MNAYPLRAPEFSTGGTIGWSVVVSLALLLASAAALAGGPASQAAPPAPAEETSETRKLNLEARAAGVGAFLDKVGEALEVRLRADPELGQQRLTIAAKDVALPQLRTALEALYEARWRATGRDEKTGLSSDWHLVHNESLQARAGEARARRREALLRGLLVLRETALRAGPDARARGLRDELARRSPALPAHLREQVDASMLQDLSLLQLLSGTAGETLLRDGSVWTPARRLPPAPRRAFGAFFARGAPGPGTLIDHPQARVEYRVLYGDGWSGPSLLLRAGWSDRWATRLFPGFLAGLDDDAGLLTGPASRAVDAEFRKPVSVEIDAAALTWDQALLNFARAAGVSVLSDSFPRPSPTALPGGEARIRGSDVGHTLDRLCAAYGYVWWKSGPFYLFRHRYWSEESRVEVPSALLPDLGRTVDRSGRLSNADLVALSALDDERLLSLRLYGSSEGLPAAPADAFDFNELQLTRAGLTLFGQMNDHLRELARADGAPYRLMNAEQRRTLEATARDRGIPLDTRDEAGPSFRLKDRFIREKGSGGWVQNGGIRLEFDYGGGVTRWTYLSLRLPAAAPTPRSPEGSQGS